MDSDRSGERGGPGADIVSAAGGSHRASRAEAEFTRLNEKYMKYCLIGLVISAAIHFAYISLGAGPTSKPYQLRERKIEVIDIPDEIDADAPPPTVEIERPVIPEIPEIPQEPEVTESREDQENQETIPETTFDPSAAPPVVPSAPAHDEFLAFDSPPQLIRAVKPEYPALALEVHAEGVVHVQVTIDETGRVIEAVVISSDTITALEDAALAAAKQSLFRPAKQRDVPVKSRISIPFRFRLN